ncbi:MAG: hypothetical protein EOP66_03075 [Sphingomonas sp.]|nr:MAG: hypothetical protein EOP66_03075 [Sphingomonas sp.]
MPRYYFDLTDQSHEADNIGVELPDEQQARVEAFRFLGEVLRYEPGRMTAGSVRVDVRSEQQTKLYSIAVSEDHSGVPNTNT